MNPIFFTSKNNYMKRDPSSGSTNMAAPVTPAYILSGSPSLYVTNFVVTHNLNEYPVFRVYYEPFGDGVIWPAMGSRQTGSVTNPNNTSNSGPGLVAWPSSSTQITIQLFYINNTLTGTFPVYFVVYKDYAL